MLCIQRLFLQGAGLHQSHFKAAARLFSRETDYFKGLINGQRRTFIKFLKLSMQQKQRVANGSGLPVILPLLIILTLIAVETQAESQWHQNTF